MESGDIKQLHNKTAEINNNKIEWEKLLDQINSINSFEAAEKTNDEYDSPPPMISRHDQNSDSDSENGDKEEDEEEEDPINLPSSSWGGSRFKEKEDPVNLRSSAWGIG